MKRLLGFFKTSFFSPLASFFHREGASERFCRSWAELESQEVEFKARSEGCWEEDERWEIAFWDLWKWNGEHCHWNRHDVGCGRGKTKRDAWKDLERKILEYENASSREEALLKAGLRRRRHLEKRGWGEEEWRKQWTSMKSTA